MSVKRRVFKAATVFAVVASVAGYVRKRGVPVRVRTASTKVRSSLRKRAS